MAHLWQRQKDGWAPFSLNEEAVWVLSEGVPATADGESGRDDRALLLYAASGQWVLLCGRKADVRVNGVRPLLPIVAMQDRDEIFLGGRNGTRVWPSFFSTEQLARPEPFPGRAGPADCVRCGQPIEPGGLAVRCPACASWHHAAESLPCWQYDEHCALCDQPTDLEAGHRWVPEEV
jgi:hypothetical protein